MQKGKNTISHWHKLLEGLQESSQQFYAVLHQAIINRQIPKVKTSKTSYAEGGVLSSRREYFVVSRYEYTFEICAAPFGSHFFISWWLSENQGCLSQIPLIRIFASKAKPFTYFRYDTALIFQELVHSAVLEVIDGITKAKGLRALTEGERKPIMRGLFS